VSNRESSIRPKREVNAVGDDEVGRDKEKDIEAENEEESPEGRSSARMGNPEQPSPREIDDHCLTHLPYRSWCSECVKGRGRQAPHRRGRGEHGLRELHMDFMFMGPKDAAGETLPCLVVREGLSKMTMAAAVPRKTTGVYVARRVMAFLVEVGCQYGDIIVRADQEPAIACIVNEVGRLRAIAGGGRYVVENSPVGASASNGMVERAIQSVQGQVRVLKLAAEKRWGVEIPHRHPVVPWMVEYAAFLLNRFEVGHDGKTAYERLKCKRARTLGIEFGEGVLWRSRPASGPLGKLSTLWDDGVCLGVRGKSGEIIVGNSKGVWKTRTVQRKPKQERWRSENLDVVVGVPWLRHDDDPNADGEKVETVKLSEKQVEEEKEMANEAIPRGFTIRVKDVEKHGYSAKCPGCLSIVKGTSRQTHSQACRKRLEELMKDDVRVKKAFSKFDEFAARALEKQDELDLKTKKDEQMNQEQRSTAGGSGLTEEERKREERRRRYTEIKS
jgi:hypothetical protein